MKSAPLQRQGGGNRAVGSRGVLWPHQPKVAQKPCTLVLRSLTSKSGRSAGHLSDSDIAGGRMTWFSEGSLWFGIQERTLHSHGACFRKTVFYLLCLGKGLACSLVGHGKPTTVCRISTPSFCGRLMLRSMQALAAGLGNSFWLFLFLSFCRGGLGLRGGSRGRFWVCGIEDRVGDMNPGMGSSKSERPCSGSAPGKRMLWFAFRLA